MKHLFLSILLVMITNFNFGQQKMGSIRGVIIDKSDQSLLPFVKIILIDSSLNQIAYTSTDFEGKYTISNLKSAEYVMEVNYVGYVTVKNKIKILSDSIHSINFELSSNSEALNCVEISYSSVSISKMASRVSVRRSDLKNKSSEGVLSATESYAKLNDNTFKNVNKKPLSTLSIDVDNASYSNIRRFINNGKMPPKDAVRIEEMINYFSYDYPQSKKDEPFAIDMEYTDCPWNKKNKIARIGIQGKNIPFENAPANNLVFLIDVSGSMNTPNKLELLKAGFNLLVNQLRKNDKIAIVVYAGAAGVVLESTNGMNKSEIKNAIYILEAGGATAGGEGLKLAYNIAKENFIKNGNNRIILATDGDFNVGISGQGELQRFIESKRNDHIFLSVLGFGNGNYKDDTMELLADKGNGNYYYIDSRMEAKKVLVKELGATLNVIAKDVKIQVEFNPMFVKSYRLIGYVNRVMDNEDFNNDKKDAGELGAGHNVTVLYEIIPANKNVQPTNYKYQNGLTVNDSEATQSDLLTVKFRYKNPKGKKSKLLTKVLLAKLIPLKLATNNTKFALAVSEFGMLLRKRKSKEKLTYNSILKLATDSKGEDIEGYRAEFINLVKKVMIIDS